MKVLQWSCQILALVSFTTCSNKNPIPIDDFLNSGFELFPNQTLSHIINLEDQTLERFAFLLEDDQILSRAYESFKRKHGERVHPEAGLSYTTNQRKQIFKDNLLYIFRHNLLVRMKGSSTFEMGANKFSDRHLDEFKEERLGLLYPEGYGSGLLASTQKTTTNNSKSFAPLPLSVEWNNEGVVSPVKDQDQCAACIMFSITSAVEAANALKNNKYVDLSEQFIIDCAVRKNGYKKNRGCYGNEFEDTLRFTVNHGITSEDASPYIGKQSTCKFEGKEAIVRVKEYEQLPDDVETVKRTLATKGPVVAGMPIFKPFIFYTSGVYDHCSHSSNAIAGHAMMISGYNDEGKVKYYNMKNQWGADWGEGGYVRYISTDSSCWLEKLAFSITV